MSFIDRRQVMGGLAVAALPAVARAAIRAVSPTRAGLRPDAFGALNQAMQALVDERKLAGVTTLVAKSGRIVNFEHHGMADLEAHRPVRADTIWRIASMTKPIIGVGMMKLWERGRWTLDDPVARHVPQFTNLRVAGPNGTLVDPASPMTMRQLMSHSAGFDRSQSPAYAHLADWNQPLQAMIDNLGRLPLAFQPGTDWRYGPSVDVQGYIIERLSGRPLDEYLEAEVFHPLRMRDTGFWAPQSQLGRVTKIHRYGPDHLIMTSPDNWQPYPRPVYLSGSGGLVSTAEDYWRFAQMLANHGTLDGARILRPATVDLMRTNVLAPNVGVNLYGPAMPGQRFGLDVAIIEDPAAANSLSGRGTYYWGGAFGTWWWNDPANDLIVIGMIQNENGTIPFLGTPDVRRISGQHIYAGLAAH